MGGDLRWDELSRGGGHQYYRGISKVEKGIDRVSGGPFSLSDGGERARQGLYNTPPGAPGDAIIPL